MVSRLMVAAAADGAAVEADEAAAAFMAAVEVEADEAAAADITAAVEDHDLRSIARRRSVLLGPHQGPVAALHLPAQTGPAALRDPRRETGHRWPIARVTSIGQARVIDPRSAIDRVSTPGQAQAEPEKDSQLQAPDRVQAVPARDFRTQELYPVVVEGASDFPMRALVRAVVAPENDFPTPVLARAQGARANGFPMLVIGRILPIEPTTSMSITSTTITSTTTTGIMATGTIIGITDGIIIPGPGGERAWPPA